MTRYYLSRLDIEGFRGINNEGEPLSLKFKPECVNSIYAQNGVGKTSIHEAICYSIFGGLPKLDALQRQEQPETYYVNRFHSQKIGTITLEFSSDDSTPAVEITVKRNNSGQRTVTSSTGHINPDEFLNNLAADFILIDSSAFLDFINAKPLERGRAFSSLIGLTRFAGIRQALTRASETRSLNSDLQITAAGTQIQTAEENIRNMRLAAYRAYEDVTGTTIQDLDDEPLRISEVTIALASVAPLTDIFANKDILSIDAEAARAAIVSAEGGETKAQYIQILADIDALEKGVISAPHQAEAATLLGVARDRDTAVNSAGNSTLRDLYVSAKSIVASNDWPNPNLCPACDEIAEKPLAEYLQTRIETYREANVFGEALKTKLLSSLWFLAAEKLESSPQLALSDGEKHCHDIKILANRNALSEGRLREAIDAITLSDNKRSAKLIAAKAQQTQLQLELPPSLVTLTQKLEAGLRFRNTVKELRAAQRELKKLLTYRAWRERWRTFITGLSSAVGNAESALSTQRMAQIQNDYQAIFKELMRGGIDMKPQLVRAANSENVDLNLENFYGETGISARAVLSESYRNAVAASIFLAAATTQKGRARFVVLDDITSSFDGGHQFALMELLRTKLQCPANADGLQFILLSHDSLLEKYFDRINSEPGWYHQKLQGAAPTGKVYANQQDALRLRTLAHSHLSSGQVDVGAPLVRQYLEFQLSQIISKVKIPVPPDYAIKSDNRTVGNALDAIKDSLDLHRRANALILDSQQQIDFSNRHTPAIIANFVSHYETGSGTPITAHVLIGVLQSIDDLVECFKYNDTQNPPQRRWYRSLSQR
jgi:DNA repair exonuclease SbcCD ATPase subunit